MLKKTHLIASFTPVFIFTGNLEYALIASTFGVISDLDLVIGIKHRTVTHSLIFAILVALLSGIINPAYGILALYGILNHIILDMLTRSGVELYWPLKRRVRISGFSYNSVIPNYTIILACILALYYYSAEKIEVISGLSIFKEALKFPNININLFFRP
ncbi:metal-dependent hydrolase [Geoglobus acetivorans]|uniref:metal-dependent hydrolase n=1 Tax=Geoglobus acetivorans TaxID=565033 RepID=UPI000694937E